MNTKEKHVKLKNISKQARNLLFERLRLTVEILADHEYVDQFGSEVKLIEIMEADEWSDFGGRPGLPALLRAYRANPQLKTWEQYRFDWGAMIELANGDDEPQPRNQAINWKEKFRQAELRIKELEAELRGLREAIGVRA